MALQSTKGTVPKNAVSLSRNDAISYQWKQIHLWPDKSDVWIYKWGVSTLGVVASVAGCYINGRYRKKLKLRDYGAITSTIPMIIGPAVFSSVAHVTLITNDLFLNETKCSVCLQQKAAGLQIVTSLLYPMIVSPIVNFYMGLCYATYRVPHWRDAKGTFVLWWKLTKPLGKSLLVLACVQAVAANYVTYMEIDSLYKIKMKLMQVLAKTEIKKAENVTINNSEC